VKDVARACRLAMETPEADGEVFNVGSGNKYTIQYIADKLAEVMGKSDIKAEITGKYRVGDIRHCFADTIKTKNILGFEPNVKFEDGLYELAEWLKTQIATDNVSKASSELSSRGLTV
jgi:dTDP-L-rhamnose 4-epimerase